MNKPTPFRISVPDTSIERLRQKLALTTFPDELDDAGWAYGAPLQDIQDLVRYWREEFDWKRQETRLNEELEQYTVNVDVVGFGRLNIHFVHRKSEVKGAIPLLFVHGCECRILNWSWDDVLNKLWSTGPGSFLEVSKLLPILTNGSKDDQPSFHVVAPSLPNFGFSEGVRKKGFGIPQYAEVCHKLMLSLGYDQYGTLK